MRRPWIRFALAIVGVAIAAFVALALRDVLRVRAALDAGATQLRTLDLDTASTPGGISAAAATGAAELDRASSIASSSPWLGVLEHVPLVGGQVDGLREMTDATAEIGHLGSEAATKIETSLDAAGGEPAARVRLLDVTLGELEVLGQRLATLHPAEQRFLLPPLSGARTALEGKLSDARSKLDDGRRSVTALRRFLVGPTQTLVLAANNAEMTAGSGMPASGGVATISDGDINLGEFVPSDQTVLVGQVLPTISDDLHRLYDNVGIAYDFRGATSSPNFPVMGQMMQQMAAQVPQYGPVDDVVVVDAYVVRDLLDVLGPVVVDGQEYTAQNVLKSVLNENYLTFGDPRAQREDRLALQGSIARAAFDALKVRKIDLTQLVKRFADNAKGRHLLAWSSDPDLERVFHDFGADGAVQPDGLVVSEINVGGNKLDWYLQPKLDISVGRGLANTFDITMQLSIANDARDPTSAQIEGTHPSGHLVLVDLHLPVNALDLESPDAAIAAMGLDPPMLAANFRDEIPAGTTKSWRFTFRLPADQQALRILPSARVHPTQITVNGLPADDSVQVDLYLPGLAPPVSHAPLSEGVAAGLVVAVFGFAFALSSLAGRKGTPVLVLAPADAAPKRARFDALAATWLLAGATAIMVVQVLWSAR
ncbi:MAG: DUF4012 domain-containing protein [Acidimicrobiales bacterium]